MFLSIVKEKVCIIISEGTLSSQRPQEVPLTGDRKRYLLAAIIGGRFLLYFHVPHVTIKHGFLSVKACCIHDSNIIVISKRKGGSTSFKFSSVNDYYL